MYDIIVTNQHIRPVNILSSHYVGLFFYYLPYNMGTEEEEGKRVTFVLSEKPG